MAYSSSTDVQTEVGGAAALTQLADLDGNGVADVGVVDSAIAQADALINSWASKRFYVPFAPVPDSIKMCSARLAAYFMRMRRRMLTEHDVVAYDNDVKWLQAIASGDALPGTEPIPAKGSIVRDNASARPSTKDVSRDKLKGFS